MDITDATNEPLAPSPSTTRRSTVSSTVQNIPQAKVRPTNSQCTHITVTRLYTTEFRCSNCLRVASLGWLWRCTQDRELLLYDDMERGIQLCDIFELPADPAFRHPVARLNPLSFLEEVTDEQLLTYSEDQLDLILKQRAEILKKAAEPGFFDMKSMQASKSHSSTLSKTPNLPDRPWLPLKGGECQFKCCHFCRQNLQERSFLSLNGIAEGDVPAAAILGFGFHLSKKRPVALAKHVKNLGLRPSPAPQKTPEGDMTTPKPAYRQLPPTPKKLTKPDRRNTSQGLALSTTNISPSSMISNSHAITQHAQAHSQTAEQGYTALPIAATFEKPTSTSPVTNATTTADRAKDVRPMYHQAATEPKSGISSTKSVFRLNDIPGTFQMGLEAPIMSTSAVTGENEKDSLVKMQPKDKNELDVLVGVRSFVEGELGVTDVITQF